MHTSNPNTWETEAGGCLWVLDQSSLQSGLQDSQGYKEEPGLKTNNNTHTIMNAKQK